MFEPLILGVIALYMLLGWIFLGLLDRGEMAQRRRPRAFIVAVLLWPITVVSDVVSRARRNDNDRG